MILFIDNETLRVNIENLFKLFLIIQSSVRPSRSVKVATPQTPQTDEQYDEQYDDVFTPDTYCGPTVSTRLSTRPVDTDPFKKQKKVSMRMSGISEIFNEWRALPQESRPFDKTPKHSITDQIEVKDLSDDAFISDCLQACKTGTKINTKPILHRTLSFPANVRPEKTHRKLGKYINFGLTRTYEWGESSPTQQ